MDAGDPTRRPASGGDLGDGQRSGVRPDRADRHRPDQRRARLHGEGRRWRARGRADLLLPLPGRSRRRRPSAARAPRPQGAVARARFGVASCSSYAQGYFHAYRALAARGRPGRRHPPGRLHLRIGARPVRRATGRIEPPARGDLAWPTTARATPSTNATPTCRRCTASTPSSPCGTITNRPTTPGTTAPATTCPTARASWAERKAAAQQAYAEWMPIRDQADPGRIWRKLAWGDLADLVLLDTRLWARTDQQPALFGPPPPEDPGAHPAGRRPGRLARGADPASRPRAGS